MSKPAAANASKSQNYSANPFQYDDSNPFIDPVVPGSGNSNASTGKTANTSTPFVNVTTGAPVSGNMTIPGGTNKASAGFMSSGSSAGGTQGSASAALAAKEEELRRREQELARRERELNMSGRPVKPLNFPPCYPVYYLNIDDEIPESQRPLVKSIFYVNLLGFWGTIVWNIVSTFAILLTPLNTGAADFGVALMNGVIFGIAAFYLWYRPVYNAFQKESSLSYSIYFLFQSFHLLYTLYMIIGYPSSGSAGLINTIQLFTHSYWVAGVFGAVDTGLWVLSAAFSAFNLRRVHAHYTTQGHSFDRARSEAVTTGLLPVAQAYRNVV